MENQEKEVQLYTGKPLYTMADKVKYYAKSVAVPATVVGLSLASQGALADGEINYGKLVDDAKDNMTNASKAVLSIFGIGITLMGAIKGYSYLKLGLKKA